MKVVPLGKVKNELSNYVEKSQRDQVLITRHGRPAAILIGVEGESIEDVLTASDGDFWALIEERRKQSKTISAEEVRRRLALDDKQQGTRRPAKRHETHRQIR